MNRENHRRRNIESGATSGHTAEFSAQQRTIHDRKIAARLSACLPPNLRLRAAVHHQRVLAQNIGLGFKQQWGIEYHDAIPFPHTPLKNLSQHLCSNGHVRALLQFPARNVSKEIPCYHSILLS